MTTLADRIANYERVMGWKDTLWLADGGATMLGYWVMGNDYRVRSGYHGGYPATFLKRVKALFPDAPKTLHLFSGKVDVEAFPGDTVDSEIDNWPTYVDNAETMETVPLHDYRLVLADPPYTGEDAEHYGTAMVKRKKVWATLSARCVEGTFVAWLDQASIQYRKDEWHVLARIAMEKSTNHRFRTLKIFVRKPHGPNTEGL
jgi:hypothetical protein